MPGPLIPPLAPGLAAVPQSRIRELADVAFGMEGVLRLQFGESNLGTPQFIKDAVTRAIELGYTFYTQNAGLPMLREAIAQKYGELHGVRLDPASEVVVTASGVQALNVAIRCVIDPGDEAVVLTPNWPNASAIVSLFSGHPREVPFAFGGAHPSVDIAALEAAITPRTKLLLYTSPSNPLGWVATPEEQRALLELCRRRGLWLLADEVYERIYYTSAVAPSILRVCTRDDAVIVAQSFSKTYCMTGWRLGWMVARRDLAWKATQLNEYTVSHAPAMVQWAGRAALEHGEEWVAELVRDLRQRVTSSYRALASVPGVSVLQPQGAFYLFLRIDDLKDSFAFALDLLRDRKVAVAPGVAFGAGGEGAIRICCAADSSVLEPAIERLGAYLRKGPPCA